MNQSEYLRRKTNGISKTIGFQNGQDASQVTLKARAIAASVPVPVPVARVGSGPADIMKISAPNPNGICEAPVGSVGTTQSGGFLITDQTGNLIASAQHCAVCSDPPSSEPFNIVIPCGINLPPLTLTPGVAKCCGKDTSQLFRDNSELVRNQGLQAALKVRYNAPNNLKGLRGAVVVR